MIFAIMILLTALLLSSVAAVYSVTGLIAIFPGSAWAIIIMGGTLEVSKVVATVWLHKYWHRTTIQFKLYLVPAIAVLMTITSMGIFGYLSASHLEQTAPTGDIIAQAQILDDKITTERDNIKANKTALSQMDAQVDQLLSRTTDDKGANHAVLIRKNQAKERKSLQDDISISQATIVKLQGERSPIVSQIRKVEAEVGPIRYIAALVYGDNPDADLLERAVRWVIMLLVFVFDPLAIVMILAADQTFEWAKKDKKANLITSIYNEVPMDKEEVNIPIIEEIIPVNEENIVIFQEDIKDLAVDNIEINIDSSGDVFPSDPEQGQQFTRTDYIPPRDFTYNGSQWVSVE